MSHGSNNHENSAKESQKAKQVMDKDTPNDPENGAKAKSSHEEPKPYLQNENVDNQKSSKSRSAPAHNNNPGRKTPVPGAQATKEKKAHKDNINEKSDKANPKASG